MQLTCSYTSQIISLITNEIDKTIASYKVSTAVESTST